MIKKESGIGIGWNDRRILKETYLAIGNWRLSAILGWGNWKELSKSAFKNLGKRVLKGDDDSRGSTNLPSGRSHFEIESAPQW
jgi:hypothetical protein